MDLQMELWTGPELIKWNSSHEPSVHNVDMTGDIYHMRKQN